MPCTILIKRTDNTTEYLSKGAWMRGELVYIYAGLNAQLGSEEMDTNKFLRFGLTDKTREEMQSYLDRYNRDFEYTLINANGTLRRYEVRNNYANSLGLGYWTTSAVLDIKTLWEEDHPNADITTIGFPNTDANGLGNIWDMSGVFEVGEGAAFQEAVIEGGKEIIDKRTIWYISPAMMAAIENAGGYLEGDTGNLGPNLRDARLD